MKTLNAKPLGVYSLSYEDWYDQIRHAWDKKIDKLQSKSWKKVLKSEKDIYSTKV